MIHRVQNQEFFLKLYETITFSSDRSMIANFASRCTLF